MFAAQHKLDNLVAMVDANGFQYGGPSAELMNMEPMGEKWRAFGWDVKEINGNDIAQLQQALDPAQRAKEKPTCVIARTIKGYGVSLFEGTNEWHHGVITREIFNAAMKELDSKEATA